MLVVAASTGAMAGEVSGYVEAVKTHADGESSPAGGPTTDTGLSGRALRVNLTWTHRLFPNLQMQIGIFHERLASEQRQDGADLAFRFTKFRPFARLNLRSEFWIAEAAWNRSDDRNRTEGLDGFRLTRDSYLGVVGWKPSRYPSLRLELARVDDRDSTHTLVDRSTTSVRLLSDYTPVDSTTLYYRGNWDHLDDQVAGTDFRTLSHTGELRFSDTYFDNRWEVGGNWVESHREVDVRSAGTGEIQIPVFPVDGGYAIDDTPDEGLLGPQPSLVDQNTLAATAVNLGLPPPAGDDRPRNLGFDLGIGRDVNLIRVWIDRELPIEIAQTFVWEIWTSPEGQFWTRTATIPTAPFGPFDLRFELRFPTVLARFLKIVVRPLSPTVPDASSWPTILVTELEPILSQPTAAYATEIRTVRRVIQAHSRVRILENPGLSFDTSYTLLSNSSRPSTWTLSNGLSLHHRFDEVWSIAARAAREDGNERGRDRVGYVYSAAVSAVPVETFRNSLVFSGTHDDLAGLVETNNGVYLSSTAAIYTGIDLTFGAGKSYNESTNGPRIDALTYAFGATIVPHRSLTILLRYDDRDATISNPGIPDRPDRTRSAEAGFAFNPLSSLYLYASRRLEWRTDEADRTVDTLAASFSPFPDGALRFIVSYNENRYTFRDERSHVLTPTLRWYVNPRTYLDATYQKIWTDSDLGSRDDEIMTYSLRIGF